MKKISTILIIILMCLFSCTGVKKTVRFSAEIENIVIDDNSGLMWIALDNGMDISWDDAHSYCSKLTIGGFNDWRLPSKYEIKDLLLKRSNVQNFITITGKYLWLNDYHTSYAGYFLVNDGHELYTPMHGGLKARVLAVRYIRASEKRFYPKLNL